MAADDVFEVVLDNRVFSVICPLDAGGGDRISVTAPDPDLNQIGDGGETERTDRSSGSPNNRVDAPSNSDQDRLGDNPDPTATPLILPPPPIVPPLVPSLVTFPSNEWDDKCLKMDDEVASAVDGERRVALVEKKEGEGEGEGKGHGEGAKYTIEAESEREERDSAAATAATSSPSLDEAPGSLDVAVEVHLPHSGTKVRGVCGEDGHEGEQATGDMELPSVPIPSAATVEEAVEERLTGEEDVCEPSSSTPPEPPLLRSLPSLRTSLPKMSVSDPSIGRSTGNSAISPANDTEKTESVSINPDEPQDTISQFDQTPAFVGGASLKGIECPLCTFYNEHMDPFQGNSTSNNSGRPITDSGSNGVIGSSGSSSNISGGKPISHSDSSGSSAHKSPVPSVLFCRVCGQDLRGDKPPPVATPIPSASPSLTVISSLR